MITQVALVRGINVGTAKQVPMPMLVQVLENLGAEAVNTVLRSGNAVFRSKSGLSGTDIEAELERVSGVIAQVLVLSGDEFRLLASENPFTDSHYDGSRVFVTFLSEPVGEVEAPDAEKLAPERISVGERAVYQWCPDGVSRSRVPAGFWRQFGGIATARNLKTVKRILTLFSEVKQKA